MTEVPRPPAVSQTTQTLGQAPVPTLVHPGPVAGERVVSVATRVTEHDVELPAGRPLLAALEELLEQTGSLALSGELFGGHLDAFSYFIPDLGPEGGPVANFSAPRHGAAPGRLIRGGITVGRKDRAVFSHSHALFVDAHGIRRAGHLIPDSVVLGSGVHARVCGSPDVTMQVEADPETLMSLFVPRRVRDTRRGYVAALMCRVRPNVDLVSVVEDLVTDQGWRAARVRGQIGSLVGGRLEQPDGSIIEVDGPATEVVFLDGTVRRTRDRAHAELSAHLVDRHATVHSGRLVPGQNPVAMTYELVLTQQEAGTGR